MLALSAIKMKNKKEEILDDIRDYKEIDAVALSKGGKRIISGLREDIVVAIDIISRDYKTATHMELVALCADLSAKMSVFRVLTNAKKNIATLEDILALEE